MSSLFDSTAPRFLRPDDVGRIQRNQRRINVQRAVGIGRRVALAVVVIGIALWMVHRAQSDKRFAVKTIEVSGAAHTSREALNAVTSAYAGANLFKIDIARVQSDLRALPWVSRIEIEKKLPDTLRIRVVERTPWAWCRPGPAFVMPTRTGCRSRRFPPRLAIPICRWSSPAIPRICGGASSSSAICVNAIRCCTRGSPKYVRSRRMHLRCSTATSAQSSTQTRTTCRRSGERFYAIANAERFGRGAIEYADLRFADRIVLKPVHPITSSAAAIVPAQSAEITN